MHDGEARPDDKSGVALRCGRDCHLEVEDRAVAGELPSGRVDGTDGEAARATEEDVVVECSAECRVRVVARAQKHSACRVRASLLGELRLPWVEAVQRIRGRPWWRGAAHL